MNTLIASKDSSTSPVPGISKDYLFSTSKTTPTNSDLTSSNKCLSLSEKQHLLTLFGEQSSAYFTLQPDAKIYATSEQGYLAYFPQSTPFGTVNIVFANPICAPEKRHALLTSFVRNTPGKAIFLGVDKTMANHLQNRGYQTTQMGVESSFRLDTFNVKGKHKKQLRHAANLEKRHAITVKELDWAEIETSAVQHISEEWRRQKAVNNRELKLLTRPPKLTNEWKVRKFYCFSGDKLLGYVFFDPYFKEGKIAGYCANILRKEPNTAPSNVLDFIIIQAIKTFKQEGVNEVSLGISPSYHIKRETSDHAGLHNIQRMLFDYGNRLYAFKALAYHKSRYRAEEEPWYLCTKDISTIKVLWAILRGTQLIGSTPNRHTTPLYPVTASSPHPT